MFAPSPSEAGGAQRHAGILAEEFGDRGWRVVFVGRGTESRRLRARREGSVLLVEVPGWSRPRIGTVAYLAIGLPIALVLGAKCEGILSMQLSSPSTLAAIAARRGTAPAIALSTTSGRLSEARLLERSGLRRRLLRSVRYFVAQTTLAEAELAKAVGPNRVVVLPNPVREVSPPPPGPPGQVVYAGRFSEEKDLLTLLAAWKGVVAVRDDVCLTLAGRGGANRSVEIQVRSAVAGDAALTRTVRLPGWVADTSALMAATDVFVFPSLSEGLSNALLEACANRRVVVASDIPGNRAVLGDDYCLLYPAGDEAALRSTLALALGDRSVRQRALDQIAPRMERFRPQRVVAQLEELLDADRPRHQ